MGLLNIQISEQFISHFGHISTCIEIDSYLITMFKMFSKQKKTQGLFSANLETMLSIFVNTESGIEMKVSFGMFADIIINS